MRRTKIVATLGPASSTPQAIEKLILGGLDVVRLNFSHGKHEEHREHIQVVREVSKRLERSVACLQDLSGPKIRTGSLVDSEGVPLETGASFILTTEDILGTRERVSPPTKTFQEMSVSGTAVLLDDGLIELEVKGVDGDDVITEVINGGFLKPQKGINLPGTALSVPSLTPKDREDAAFGCKLDIDFIALSFVRAAADIRDLKELVAEQGRADILVIAKIEKPEAVEHLDSILDVADGVMVARGDLGVEASGGKGAYHTKGDHLPSQSAGEGRNHGNADVGIHGASSPPHEGGGLRRSQRHLGWDRRSHALGRDGRRTLSRQSRDDHVAHCPLYRGIPTGQ